MRSKKKRPPRVTLYTAAYLEKNPGTGAWSAILRAGKYEKKIGGYHHQTTNMRMHLTAAVHGILAVKTTARLTILSRSEYVEKTLLNQWKCHSNQDIIAELLTCRYNHEIEIRNPKTPEEYHRIREAEREAQKRTEA